MLALNKDQDNPHKVAIRFEDPVCHGSGGFTGSVATVTFGKAEYQWRPGLDGGKADPDGTPASSSVEAGIDTSFVLPPASITVLRGNVVMRTP